MPPWSRQSEKERTGRWGDKRLSSKAPPVPSVEAKDGQPSGVFGWSLARPVPDVQLPSERPTFMPSERFAKTPPNHELRRETAQSSAW